MRVSIAGNSGMLPSANSTIPRPRLDNVLRDALTASPLVLLQAPFGSGKTTLIDSVLRGRDDAALFRARPWHRGSFIEDLVLAVRDVRPEFGRRTIGGASAQFAPEAVARLFLSDLKHIPAQLILAIDNAEHLSDDADFTRFIDAVANALPNNVHILLSGRTLPAISAQTIVRIQAITIPSDALTFSDEELADALETNGVAADEAAVERISRLTKGWAASVSLALRSRDETGLQYVSDALLAALDSDTRAFLARVAVFERIDRAVLEKEPAYEELAKRVALLEKAGTPLTRDDRGYVLHPLVRAVALQELERSGKRSEAHMYAAQAFARHGNLAAALFHVRESGDERATDGFMRAYGASIVRTGNRAAIRDTLDLLRSTQTNDVRAYINALLAKDAGGDEMQQYLEEAAVSSDERIAFAARAEQIERSIARTGRANSALLADVSERAARLGVDACARAAIYEAWSSATAFDFPRTLKILEPLRGIDDSATRFNTGVLYAYARMSLGETDAALAELDALVRLFENDDRVIFAALTLVWQARLALLAGYTNVAGEAARAALRLMETLSLGAEEAALYLALTEIATHEGNVGQTVAFAERLASAAPRAWYSGDAARARAFAEISLARAAFIGHDTATARDLAIRTAEDTGLPDVQRTVALSEAAIYANLTDDKRAEDLYERAASASVQAQPRDTADAIALATSLDLIAFLAGAQSWQIQAPNVPQLAPFQRLIDARRGLVTTAHAAIALNNLRSGTATAEPFNAALTQMARDGERFDIRLLRAFAPREPIAAGIAKPESFDLTAREMEILTLLVDGLSNKEIAQRLILSPRTVETHVERVLGKLEVGSRSRAIAKALRLGLVELV